ncbi:MAG: FAD-dependent oxidoreductase [Chloroflexota bacterium]
MAEHNLGPAESFLKDGEMKRVELEGKPLVIARVGGEYFAVGGNCSHYGAPLDKGVLKGHTLMCPWHHACFDIRTAARVEPPALNDLARYPVRVDDGALIVSLPHTNEREPQGRATEPGRQIVIVGGGAAGNAAAEELRRLGYPGRIIIVSAASSVPVDRPNLSKDYLAGEAQEDWIPLRSAAWYEQRDIDLRLNTRVARIDPQARQVWLENGESLSYEKLLLCTGGVPRRLNAPGADLQNIYTLRTLPDAEAIIKAAENSRRAVIIGASFIGMEVAASLRKGREIEVTVVGLESTPFEHVLGREIGQLFQREHEANGVRFRLNAEVAGFEGENGRVTGVRLKNGDLLPADFVVVGIGVRPATDFLKDSGLALEERDGSVLVDTALRTSAPDIFAAGDIARWEQDGDTTRIEHWRAAQQQGIVAARGMFGQPGDINAHVPFFWTNQWGLSLRYVGHATKWDGIVFRGSPEERQFIAFYVQDGRLRAAAGMKHDRDMDAIEFILRDRLPLTPEQMRDPSFDLVAYARQSR